jgi:hypothetical protein
VQLSGWRVQNVQNLSNVVTGSCNTNTDPTCRTAGKVKRGGLH